MSTVVRLGNEFATVTRTPIHPQVKDLKNWVAVTEGKEIYPNYWAAKGWRCIKTPYRQ